MKRKKTIKKKLKFKRIWKQLKKTWKIFQEQIKKWWKTKCEDDEVFLKGINYYHET